MILKDGAEYGSAMGQMTLRSEPKRKRLIAGMVALTAGAAVMVPSAAFAADGSAADQAGQTTSASSTAAPGLETPAIQPQSISLDNILTQAKNAVANSPQYKQFTELTSVTGRTADGKPTDSVDRLAEWNFNFTDGGGRDARDPAVLATVDAASGNVTLSDSVAEPYRLAALPTMTPYDAVKLAQAKGVASSFSQVSLTTSSAQSYPFYDIYQPDTNKHIVVDTHSEEVKG
ncbi:hypothetical protein K4749_21820 [Streptomyces sp. TRM72054]|uniref:hypothetical protein n=1 Tax=Streptomyces sp. TRM72054 TaxID=2870562 RepID=UPI001C8C1648|nr:hypothetical protein [Streptomyces sp. TRM72054]MBX9396163.1 hypothetical protein [Streptomyces sp. TRM72054]